VSLGDRGVTRRFISGDPLLSVGTGRIDSGVPVGLGGALLIGGADGFDLGGSGVGHRLDGLP
jgi:hypothetical protein